MYVLFAVLEAVQFHLLRRSKVYLSLLGAGVLLFLLCTFILPPKDFPTGKIISIPEDASAGEVISVLEEEGVIGSSFWFKALARVFGVDREVHAGKYLFLKPQGMLTVLYRVTNGVAGIPTVRVTFPEGTSVREMGIILKESLPPFDSERFVALALEKEGYLFPDTYLFFADISPEEVIERLEETFTEKSREVELPEERTLEEIVIMASLLEKEAKTLEEKRIIAGILWKRFDAGMALQVDAVFGYIKQRDTYSPSFDDLEIDSPYNTYLYPGLPPGAINNPGLESLVAAATPVESDYWYYLTGKDGEMYYAETFEGHKENRELYLR